MAYIASDKIKVFPTTKRVGYQQDSRLITESSLVNIINQLISVDSFVITSEDDLDVNNPFEFNIGGYYFRASKLSDITGLFSADTTILDIYANITLSTTDGYRELVGQDDSSGGNPVYTGITFSNTASTGTNDVSLLILSRTSGTSSDWKPPETSRFKYDSSSVELMIDGGIIS